MELVIRTEVLPDMTLRMWHRTFFFFFFFCRLLHPLPTPYFFTYRVILITHIYIIYAFTVAIFSQIYMYVCVYVGTYGGMHVSM